MNQSQNFEMLPDIEEGYLIFGFGEEGKNKWQTNIKAALMFSDSERVDTYYLSKECRAESLKKNDIFTIGKYEFCPIVSNKGDNFVIRSYPLIPKIPRSKKFDILTRFSKPVNLFVKNKKIEILSFKEVLNLLNRNLSKNDIYLKFSYQYKDEFSTIICPVNYINYKKTKHESYLQVIQGDIIVKDEYKLKHAYIAAQIREDNTHAELIIKELGTSLIRHKLENFKSKLSILKKCYWFIFGIFYKLIPFYEFNYNKRIILGNIPIQFFRYSKIETQ